MPITIERAGGTIFSERNSLRHPKFIAHRGYHMAAPENSLPAFRIAAEMGAWAIETDIHKTLDGVMVCCHNDTVDDYCNGTGKISEMTFKELSELRIIKGHGLRYYTDEEYRIPTFREYLEICRLHGAIPFLEFKENLVEEALFALRSMGIEDHSVFSAISLPILQDARKLTDRVFLHWIFGNKDEAPLLADLGYAGMSYKFAKLVDVPDGLVDETHRLGLRVCFRAADTREEAIRAISMGVDYIPSNTLVKL